LAGAGRREGSAFYGTAEFLTGLKYERLAKTPRIFVGRGFSHNISHKIGKERNRPTSATEALPLLS
jgi:hypothetical protein